MPTSIVRSGLLSILLGVLAPAVIHADDVPVGAIVAWDPFERVADGQPRMDAQGRPVRRALAENWRIADGKDGTPDLRGMFLRGAQEPGATGRTGGSALHEHGISHSHGMAHDHPVPGHSHAIDHVHSGTAKAVERVTSSRPGGNLAAQSSANVQHSHDVETDGPSQPRSGAVESSRTGAATPALTGKASPEVSGAAEHLPPHVLVVYIIKVR